jgi:biopolymer transport protein ExbB
MLSLLTEGDAITRVVALALLIMSVATWVLILWKTSLLWRASRSLPRSLAAFWQAADLDDAEQRLQVFDSTTLLLPLVRAARLAEQQPPASLGSQGDAAARCTRLLRDALQSVLSRLQHGQMVLASVGAVAPFVGLLGTVWAIYLALVGLGDQGSAAQVGIEQISGPVGEALVITAAGLAVAIPAVLAYNALGRRIEHIEAELEGFAHDLRELVLNPAGATMSRP